MTNDRYIDYEILHTCQFPVESVSRCEIEVDCGKPAPYRVYWIDVDGTKLNEEMFVCEEHFKFIMECEKNQNKG